MVSLLPLFLLQNLYLFLYVGSSGILEHFGLFFCMFFSLWISLGNWSHSYLEASPVFQRGHSQPGARGRQVPQTLMTHHNLPVARGKTHSYPLTSLPSPLKSIGFLKSWQWVWFLAANFWSFFLHKRYSSCGPFALILFLFLFQDIKFEWCVPASYSVFSFLVHVKCVLYKIIQSSTTTFMSPRRTNIFLYRVVLGGSIVPSSRP